MTRPSRRGFEETHGKDFARAEMFSLPVTLLILLVAFGALIAAGVPILLALSAVGSAMGLAALSQLPDPGAGCHEQRHPADRYGGGGGLLAVLSQAGTGGARQRRVHIDAVEIAAATSGHAVVVSGVAVIIAMAGMFLAGDDIFASFGVGSILVVAVSVLGSLTVLPALLAKLGRWVDRPRIPVLWRLTAPRPAAAEPRFWSAILRPALRYPLVTFVVSAAVLVALAVPALSMNLKLPSMADMPRDTDVMLAYDRLTTAFPSTGSNHVVVVRTPAAQAHAVDRALDSLSAKAAADPLFAHDRDPEVRRSPDGTVSMLFIGTPHAAGTAEASQSLDRLRGDLVPRRVRPMYPELEYAVTGEIAGTTDYSNHVTKTLPIVVGFVLLMTFLVMAWTFRSLVVAATAIVLNLLSVGAAYGVLVLVFQNSWAEALLGFQSNGGIIAWLPIFLFVVLFGLSMDYHVFVVSRIREAVLAGVPTREAVQRGITRTAGVVTSAAAVMIGVFAIFGSLSTLDMKQLGVGLATAILIDATIIRAVVLPSAMTLLGRWNWWAPRFMRQRPTAIGPQIEDAPALTPVMTGAGQR